MTSFLDNSSGYLTHVAGLLFKRKLISAMKVNEIDLTPEQWAILNKLEQTDGLVQRDVGKVTFKDNANVTRILDKLEAKGLVQRKALSTDRRIWNVFITQKGKSVRASIEPLATSVLEKATKGLSKGEVDEYNRIARVIIANLEE